MVAWGQKSFNPHNKLLLRLLCHGAVIENNANRAPNMQHENKFGHEFSTALFIYIKKASWENSTAHVLTRLVIETHVTVKWRNASNDKAIDASCLHTTGAGSDHPKTDARSKANSVDPFEL